MTSKRRDGGHPHRFEPVAGNGLLDRRALLGGGLALAGAMGDRRFADRRRRRAAEGRTVEPGAGRRDAGRCRRRRAFEKHVVRTLSNPQNEMRTSHARTPHQSAQRHGHAQQPALLDQSFRHAGHRSRQAQAGDPRHGEAAAGVHARRRCRAIRW